jgi:hypothetical protein
MRKYRIVIGNSSKYPYRIEQRKKFLFIPYWVEIEMESSLESARYKLKSLVKNRLPPEGTVMEEYDETDLVADILKGN